MSDDKATMSICIGRDPLPTGGGGGLRDGAPDQGQGYPPPPVGQAGTRGTR
jgi:hypothetical protein